MTPSTTTTPAELPRKRKKIKRRTTRACDNCRKTKTKCEVTGGSDSCDYCAMMQLECRFTGPTTKRGPAKGYLQALEARCHNVEAVLGILLSLPDERAISLLEDLADDPYARGVLEQVNTSAFGPSGREAMMESSQSNPNQPASADSSTDPSDRANPFVSGPTNAWQDLVISEFPSEYSGERPEPFGMRRYPSPTPSTSFDDQTIRSLSANITTDSQTSVSPYPYVT